MLRSNKMQVRLLFFATLKDIVGERQLQIDLPAGSTIADLLTRLESSYPRFRDYRPVLLTAINEDTTFLLYAGDWFPVSSFGIDRFSSTINVTVPARMIVIGSGTLSPGSAPALKGASTGSGSVERVLPTTVMTSLECGLKIIRIGIICNCNLSGGVENIREY